MGSAETPPQRISETAYVIRPKKSYQTSLLSRVGEARDYNHEQKDEDAWQQIVVTTLHIGGART